MIPAAGAVEKAMTNLKGSGTCQRKWRFASGLAHRLSISGKQSGPSECMSTRLRSRRELRAATSRCGAAFVGSALTRISLTSRANTRVHVDTHTHLTPHLSARPTPCSPENSYTVSPCHIAPHAVHRLLFQMRGSRSTRAVPAVSRVGYGVGGIGVTSMTRRSVPLWFPVLAVVVGVGVDVGGGLVCHCNLYLLFPPAYLSLLPALVGYRVGPSVVSCAVVLTWCCDRALQGIALCMFAWWGCVQVYKASEWEKQNPSEDDDNRSQATGGPPDSPVVSSQPNSQHSI